MTLHPNRLSTIILAVSALSLGSAGVVLAGPANPNTPIITTPTNGNSSFGHKKMTWKNPKWRAKRQERRQAKRQKRLAEFDINRDGQLDKNERLTMKKTRFVLLDANNNGEISRKEIHELHEKRRAEKRASKLAKRGKRNAKMHKRGQRMKKRFAKRFAKRDLDNSGTLSWGEFSKKTRHGKRARRGKRMKKS